MENGINIFEAIKRLNVCVLFEILLNTTSRFIICIPDDRVVSIKG